MSPQSPMKRPGKTLGKKRAAFRPVSSTKSHKSNCPKIFEKKCPLKVLWNALEKLWEKNGQHFALFYPHNLLNRIAPIFFPKNFVPKIFFPKIFFPKKKFSQNVFPKKFSQFFFNILGKGACPWSRSSRMMMGWCSPPPYPLPAPIQTTDFWAFCPWQGWGRVGARAGLVLGMITPPSTPLPLALFSSGSCQGKGGRRRPYDAPIFPAPSPTSLPRRHARSWRGTALLGREGGGGAGTGYQRPPYHPLT